MSKVQNKIRRLESRLVIFFHLSFLALTLPLQVIFPCSVKSPDTRKSEDQCTN